MYVLCLLRRPAIAATAGSGFSPFFVAVMIFFCAGQIRIQTFAAMIVPNIAPRWIAVPRNPKPPKCEKKSTAAVATTSARTVARARTE